MFRLRALGGLVLESDSATIPTSARQRRRVTLLVVLARAGERGISRDRLQALLWPESTEESARHALDQLLYATRRDLGKHVVSSEGGQLRLSPKIVWCDVAQFEVHLERGDWEPAVSLYAGPFLDGVHLGDSVALERWVDAERGRLEQGFFDALEHLARDATKRGDAQAAVNWWRRRVAADPLSERGALGLVRALVASGDRIGALRFAQTYSMLLKEELDAEPDAEFLALTDRLTQEQPAPPAVEPAPLRSATAEAARTDRDIANTTEPPSPGRTPALQYQRARPIARGRPARLRMVALLGCAMAVTGVAWWALRGAQPSEAARALPATHANPASLPDAAQRTVAVLPFVDMSPNRDHEYLADGITEELINALSKVEGLHVVARTSVFTFKGQNADVREIGAKLGARTVLAGSIRQSGDRLRITVQLVDARKGHQLWSETYDRKVYDVFVMQEEIARAVVQTLHPALLRRSPEPLVATYTENAAAYQLYMQGRYFWNQRTEKGLLKSIDRFEQAIRLDPGYALAYSGLSDAHNALADNGYVPAEPALEKAEAAVRTALKLDSELAEAYSSLAHLKLHRWDWEGAEQDFRRAIELNPSYAIAYQYYAFLLTFHRRFDEAIPLIRRAQHLDPLSPAIQSNFGNILYLARRYPEAIEQLRFTLQMDSTRDDARRLLGRTLTELGRQDEAATELQRVISLAGGWHRSAVSALGYTYARVGHRADAEQVRTEIESARRAGKTVSPYYYAGFLGVLGRRDEAFAMLDQAYTSQPNGLVAVAVDPMMDPLRSDPRFAAFLRRLGFKP